MKNSKITEYIFWLVSYYPVLVVVLYKNFEIEVACFFKINFKDFYIYREYISFGIIIITTLILYRVILKVFISSIQSQVTKHKIKQSIVLNSFNKLSLDKYSFFILSLMLPFIFQSTDNVFDLMLIIALILLLIHVMVKMNQIMVNPIFLFSNLKIYEANISKDNNVNNLNVAIVTNLSIEDLEQIDKLLYYEYFNKVYFIMEKS